MVYYNLSGYNKDMFLAGIISWWYSDGFVSRIKLVKNRLAYLADFFSINLLISTLFAPYRQISAGRVLGPINIRIRAFFDRLLSRIIGACVRTFMIILGTLVMIFQIIFGIAEFFIWLILPIFPVAGLILMVIGWVPQWII